MLALFQRVIDQPSLAPKRWLITVHSCKEESLGPSVGQVLSSGSYRSPVNARRSKGNRRRAVIVFLKDLPTSLLTVPS